jgi:hypothetical protein
MTNFEAMSDAEKLKAIYRQPKNYEEEEITIFKLLTGEEILSTRGWSEEALIFACKHDGLYPFSVRHVEGATISDLRFAFFSESSVLGWERYIRQGTANGSTGRHFPPIGTAAAQAIGPDADHIGAAVFKDAPSMVASMLARDMPKDVIVKATMEAFPELTQRALGALLRGAPDDDDSKAANISAVQRALGLKKK